MFGYLASQLATVPHVHGQSGKPQPSDHSARPHVHVAWFGHGNHSHDDHSRDDGHTHHHEWDGSRSQPFSSDPNAGHGDHDSDAVYFPNDTGASYPGKSVASLNSFDFLSTLALAAVPTSTTILNRAADAFLPDKCSSGCALFLALRIAPSDLRHSCRFDGANVPFFERHFRDSQSNSEGFASGEMDFVTIFHFPKFYPQGLGLQ